MKYFELFGLPCTLTIDNAELQKKFYILSRNHHPDFTANESQSKQNAQLHSITEINIAYQTLKDFNKRLNYILTLKRGPTPQKEIDTMFLMEMMDLNDLITEWQENKANNELGKKIISELQHKEKELQESIQPIIQNFDFEKLNETDWNTLENYRLQMQYLNRLHTQMRKDN